MVLKESEFRKLITKSLKDMVNEGDDSRNNIICKMKGFGLGHEIHLCLFFNIAKQKSVGFSMKPFFSQQLLHLPWLQP